MEASRITLGSLNSVCVGKLENRKVVVLCHGFGAPGDDLVGLAHVLPKDDELTYIFPEAPLKLPPMFGGGRAWWNIDFASRQEQIARDGGLDMSKDIPAGLDSAQNSLASLITECQSYKGIKKDIVVGGFSQGAMVTMDWALQSDTKVCGIIQWSSTFLSESIWKPSIKSLDTPVFQSHGTEDPILPFSMAEKLANELKLHNDNTQFHVFNGPHAIPDTAIKGAAASLRAWLDL